jgi:hypothetical protein
MFRNSRFRFEKGRGGVMVRETPIDVFYKIIKTPIAPIDVFHKKLQYLKSPIDVFYKKLQLPTL